METKIISHDNHRFGRLLASLREYSGKTVVDAARFLGISPEEWIQMESGEMVPSLPQIEAVSFYFCIPVNAFFEKDRTIQPEPELSADKVSSFIALRNRTIGAAIKQKRISSDVSEEKFARQLDMELQRLIEFESGLKPIPISILKNFAQELGADLMDLTSDLTPKKGTEETNHPTTHNSDTEISADLRTFVDNPANLPYLELAKKLSAMDAAQLRRIAEGILEITY